MAASCRSIAVSTGLDFSIGWGVLKQAKTYKDTQPLHSWAESTEFTQLRHQLSQKLNNILEKLRLIAPLRNACDSQSGRQYRQQADLLMAHLEWEQSDFSTLVTPSRLS